jgi:hypothetical protein
MTCDILKEDPLQSVTKFAGDTGNMGPEVAGVVCALALSGHAERLTRIASQHGVDCASKGGGVKGGKVVPDRRRGKVSGALGGDDCFPGIVLPFDKASGVESRFCEHEAHIKATGSGAE